MSACTLPHTRVDRVTASVIRQLPAFASHKAFLPSSSLPVRTGERPATESCLPHAQMTQQSPNKVFDELTKRATKLMKAHPVRIDHSTVSMPSTFPCFHLQCSHNNSKNQYCMPADACMSPGGPRQGATEFAHIHTQYYAPDSDFAKAQATRPWQAWQGGGQGSMHLCLTLQDTATVLEKGWGERHLLATSGHVPEGLILVYSPRTMEEVDVVMHILQASLDFAQMDEQEGQAKCYN